MESLPEHFTYYGHTMPIWTLSWSPNGRFIASGSDDTTVQVWNVASKECLCTYNGLSNVQTLAWSPEGSLIVSGYYNETAQVWRAFTGECIQVYRGHSHEIESVSWSPNGLFIASASSFDHAVHIWQPTTGNLVFSCESHQVEYMDTAWSPNGRMLACAGDEEIQIWDIVTRSPVYLTQPNLSNDFNRIYTVSWSPDDQYIVSGSTDGKVRIWDVERTQVKHIYSGHKNIVLEVAWSPDGNYIASSSDDGVKIWSVATGECRFYYSGEGKSVLIRAVSWSPDSSYIAYGEGTGEIQVLKVM